MDADVTRRTLLVEDDRAIRDAVTDGLRLHGFEVTAVPSAEAALDVLARAASDILIVDIGLPGMSGVDLCTSIRSSGSIVPILILSANDAVGDRVGGLQAGADDYLVKPFDLTELVARLNALVRRAAAPPVSPAPMRRVVAGSIVIDPDTRAVTANGHRLDLTQREYELLETLARNRNVVLSRIRLLELVWGYDFSVDTNVVDVFIGYLRKKLAETGIERQIRTVRGVGFVLDAQSGPTESDPP